MTVKLSCHVALLVLKTYQHCQLHRQESWKNISEETYILKQGNQQTNTTRNQQTNKQTDKQTNQPTDQPTNEPNIHIYHPLPTWLPCGASHHLRPLSYPHIARRPQFLWKGETSASPLAKTMRKQKHMFQKSPKIVRWYQKSLVTVKGIKSAKTTAL